MNIATIRAMIVLVLSFFSAHLNKPQVKKIALNLRDGINDLYNDFEEDENEFPL